MGNACIACEYSTNDPMVELCDHCWRDGVRPAPADTTPEDATVETTYRRAGSLKPGAILAITRDRHAPVETADRRAADPYIIDITARIPTGGTVTMPLRSTSNVRVVKPQPTRRASPGEMTINVLVTPIGRCRYWTSVGRRTGTVRASTAFDLAGVASLVALETAKLCGWVQPTAEAVPDGSRFRVTVQQ